MSRVLIVEDEEAIADLEKDYLELSGFTVEIENNGTAGLKRALSEEFDMFILDLMLPGTDGFEICKKIREEKNTPILMVSENPNHVFTKEELFREIWDMESVGDIATVTVHIKKIREKIEMNTNKPQYIETIWGVGYRFKL